MVTAARQAGQGPFQVSTSGTTPFTVSVPNGGESYAGGSTQTVTWNNAGTTAAPFGVANVMISLSTDGGLTYPTTILASTPNDGSEALTIPAIATTTARVKVEAIGNVFFDISNANFIITAPATGYTFNSVAPANINCGTQASADITLSTTAQGGFSTPVNLAASGNPAGTTVSFSVNPLTPGNNTVVTLNNVNTLSPGTYNIIVTGTAGTVVQTSTLSYIVAPGIPPSISSQPAAVTVCAGADAVFNVTAAGTGLSYQWQVSMGGGGFTDIAGANTNSYTATAIAAGDNNNQYQVVVSTTCGTSTSTPATLTVNTPPAITSQPADVVSCAGNTVTFSVSATGTGLTYQWQVSTTGCPGPVYTDLVNQTNSVLTLVGITAAQNGFSYRCIVSGICPPPVIISDCVTLTVNGSVNITTQPADIAVCSGSDAAFSVVVPGTGVTYQWQVNTGSGFTDIAGATSATLLVPAVTVAEDGNQYQVVVTSSTCTTPATSSAGALAVTASPLVTVTTDATNVCTGNPVILTASGADAYTWAPVALSGETITVNPAIDPANPGAPNTIIYTVTGTSSATACSDTATIAVTANPLPTVTLIATPANTNIFPGQTIVLTATATPPGQYVFTWEKDGVVIPNYTATTLTASIDDLGSYTVTAGDASGNCSGRSNTLKIADSATTHFYIYPNPNTGQFVIDYHNPGGIPVKRNVTIYDSKGARVYTNGVAVMQPYQKINIDMRNAASGVYIIELSDGSGNRLASEKLVIRR